MVDWNPIFKSLCDTVQLVSQSLDLKICGFEDLVDWNPIFESLCDTVQLVSQIRDQDIYKGASIHMLAVFGNQVNFSK